MLPTRRQVLALAALAQRARGAAVPGGGPLLDYFVRELGAADERRRRSLESLAAPRDLDALRVRVRRDLLEAVGGFPERTPLNARETGVLARPGYVIEKIVFESRPSFFVTANVYRPKSGAARRPAVIQSCGHYGEGKAWPDYQQACAGLARKGFVALVFDPLGQGERLMYGNSQPTTEHNMAGRPCFLLGKTLAQFRIWDAMRALDYLESRPDVDKTRLGMFGHSGGGMTTLLTAPLEDRLQAVMSCCAVTSFYHKFRAFLPGDAEQVVPHIYDRGIDHPELIAACAPRAFLIGAALRDFVPLEGARRTYSEAQKLFAIAGARERLGKVETDDEHKLNRELREACYGWMLRHLAGERGDAREPDLPVEKVEDLRCTPKGSVLDLPGCRTVFDINCGEARRITRSRRVPAADLRALLGLPADLPPPRKLGGAGAELRVESEPGIELAATLSGPERRGVLLVLAAEQGRNSPGAAGLAQRFVAAGYRVLDVDVRGWPATGNRGGKTPNEEFFAIHAIELGRPLLGMRVRDLLAFVRVVRGEYERVYCIGVQGGGLVALHAAALDRAVAGAAAFRTLRSYQDVLEQPVSAESLASFVPGALAHYDLPDLVRAIQPRPFVAVEPCDEDTAARRILSGLGL